MVTISKRKGGNLNNKGFAISGVLYPVLILALFLIIQILFMMQSRKTVLDRNKKELIETINTENKVYTNEELSALVNDQSKTITNLTSQLTTIDNKYKTAVDELKRRNLKMPIGEYNLFLGNYMTNSSSYVDFQVAYSPLYYIHKIYGNDFSKKYKICMEFTTSARESYFASVMIQFPPSQTYELKSNLWGSGGGAIATHCTDLDPKYMAYDGHAFLSVKVDAGHYISVYRVYLKIYES